MATYAEITAFDEPQLLFALFEQGDLDFKLVSKATQIIEELDQGRLIDQLLLLNQQERLLVADFKQRIKNQWTQDLGILTLKDPSFWIKNRSYIQNDHYLRHNLSERVALWDTFGSLLEAYQNELTLDIARLDRINHGFMKERYFIYWRYRVIALELRAAASEAIMRLALVRVGLRKNHETFEFHAKAFKFAI